MTHYLSAHPPKATTYMWDVRQNLWKFCASHLIGYGSRGKHQAKLIIAETRSFVSFVSTSPVHYFPSAQFYTYIIIIDNIVHFVWMWRAYIVLIKCVVILKVKACCENLLSITLEILAHMKGQRENQVTETLCQRKCGRSAAIWDDVRMEKSMPLCFIQTDLLGCRDELNYKKHLCTLKNWICLNIIKGKHICRLVLPWQDLYASTTYWELKLFTKH